MTDARQRLVFIDIATDKEYKWAKDYRAVGLAVFYLGQRVGTLTDIGSDFAYWKFSEQPFGTHAHKHHMTGMRTHLLRYFDAKYARMAIALTRGVL